LKETEARNAELAVINSIQQAVGAALDFQAIVDLVGDKLREVFATGDILITWRDEATAMRRLLYSYEHGVRSEHAPVPDTLTRPIDLALLKRQPVTVRNRAEAHALGLHHFEGTDVALSSVFVPMFAGDRFLGTVILENYEREDAFGEAEVRLLSTVAASMGVALENARLFDETQRLLKETEQRNAQLAVINSIQRGMAEEMNFQAIIDLVGEKLVALFDAGTMGVFWLDEAAGLLRMPFAFEAGKRFAPPPSRLAAKRGTRFFDTLESLQPVRWNTKDEYRAWELSVVDGTEMNASGLMVPICAADRMLGVISLESLAREHAFDDADQRLLSTVAASMGVALENARLLEETQRRERESTALAEVGRDLSSTLDLATVMDRIAAHARELLAAQNSAIFLPDAASGRYRAIVALGELAEALKATAIEPGQGIIGSLLQSGQAERINDSAADPRAVQIPGTQTRSDERLMVVPLLAGSEVLGAMAVWRSGGSPFEARELAFLEGLSRQAVIALHNARLFDETRAALERQTASAEVLQVIAGSMADAQPVFEGILDSCARLFNTPDLGIFLTDDAQQLHATACRGNFNTWAPATYPRPVRGSTTQISVDRGSTVYWADTLADPQVPAYLKAIAQTHGNFAGAVTPLLWQGRGIGSLNVMRNPPRPFSAP
ncbi:MAG: GAF domain-containing protein, partial [Bacteriovorax sp.]|nr:GAF domain-containing protein [Rhizobacter sp.]